MVAMAAPTHPLRIFGISGAITLVTIILVWIYLGPQAALITALLSIIEITFSFDNAIINAKILKTMSPFWQKLFLTVGIVIAVFGMRLVFPIAIVAITSGLSWQTVIDLALNNPEKYAHSLESSYPLITAFGGSFLLMLGLHFFFNKAQTTFWLPFESMLARIGHWWVPLIPAVLAVFALSRIPGHPDSTGALIAGIAGICVYLVIHTLSSTMEHNKSLNSVKHKTGLAAFWSFLYLEVLDASFSFDGVLGAFAITSDVVIIAAGLGIGAFWVRSLTVYMVRRELLDQYKYLEHGAHYTILLLAVVLLASVFVHLPEAVPGLLGLGIIGLSVYASRREGKKA